MVSVCRERVSKEIKRKTDRQKKGRSHLDTGVESDCDVCLQSDFEASPKCWTAQFITLV